MTAVATDFSQFQALRNGAEQNDPAVLREVASQFEALFIEQLLKNMRAGELAEGLFGDSDQHEMYQELMDQQLALHMSSGPGIGLADMLVQQLGGEAAPVEPTSESFLLTTVAREPMTDRRFLSSPGSILSTATGEIAAADPAWSSPDSFVRDIWPHAERIAEKLKVAPEGIMAQAALETGWGTHVMQHNDGASSHNLFGIKASGDWSGASVSRRTLEYADGVAEYKVERFRSYPDIASTFDDYARLIEQNPRYSEVLGTGADIERFATALQDAGYATDPMYAAKISRVFSGETMQAAMHALKVQ